MILQTPPALADNGRQLQLFLSNGQLHLDALWLRERLPQADTLDPQTGQRLIEAAELPLDLALTAASAEKGELALAFSDGQQGRFPLAELARSASTGSADTPPRELWDAALEVPSSVDFSEALTSDAALLTLLLKLERFGFVHVSGLPDDTEAMQPLIDRIGPLRRTNWGGIADVKSVANAYDLTMTQRGLEPHTDNPYRDPIPGYIWLHCLTNAAEGGDSTLVDGFEAARRLRQQDPEAFDCLTRVSPRFRYQDDATHLESRGPLIECDPHGEVVRVRYSNRTERVDAMESQELRRYYAARKAFYDLIRSEALTLRLKLSPGEMLIMDNYRLLHGRTSFTLDGGVRHLRQGYVDRDSTASRRLVLSRHLAGVTS
ncbi:TauD/TfdA family dioxygenase [Halomonas sp. DP8Y7-1]|uniref:2-trimethylaminoethylphosphonate dioxygenase n=1 Tax=Halomonas sp. DP8Y7-1 TaxID=2859078 RepID=UPI001C95EDF6|nr:TauD/TfdA family dioxygenase [Halomonas sp. DP8Y7-1]MBY6029588.1 TauD/TfdA family dioxygenase [Halomonas sp. DP8Y7-1]